MDIGAHPPKRAADADLFTSALDTVLAEDPVRAGEN